MASGASHLSHIFPDFVCFFSLPLSGDMIVDIFKVPGNASCAMHLGKAAPSLASEGDSLQAQLKLKPGKPRNH